ncbi:MAG: PhzF family phenazine biosynthesis protein [Chitinophagaceae bacterium]|nr:PhzF family phenazine biosynthesis protein [Chitinophagaceae bacterium]
MKLNIYQVDAFAGKLFSGNPAAVIPLKKWLPDELLQQIAMENNLSETVFFVEGTRSSKADFNIRWFTPLAEVNLCGHATLAAAFVIFNILKKKKKKIIFDSKSGFLLIKNDKGNILMDFPSWKPERVEDYPSEFSASLGGKEIVGVYKHRDWLVELLDEDAVASCQPDFSLLRKHFGELIITAPGKDADFVSRFFAPGVGIDEDPVTGSAHSQLIPFWSEKLDKSILYARQLSKRGGQLYCEQLNEERVIIGGECVFYMNGIIKIK